ncbi:GbsR/MarR family transcriptional regulator [Zhouia sp. PK063]|uniref:GbsR/MarR family transcriptional regulator n=1 Tax=Zhouia sp. PK063 TaxID=3373602 RepID=UPI0037B88A7F
MNCAASLLEQRKMLTEELGVYFESCEGMSPLSARIYAYIVLQGEEGASFEELQEELEASKSSISTNLQVLQSMGRLGYYTKPGDRKRYFKIHDDQILNRLDDKIEVWKKERCLHKKVLKYRTQFLKFSNTYHEEEKGLLFNKHYIDFIDAMIDNLDKLKTNIQTTLNQE